MSEETKELTSADIKRQIEDAKAKAMESNLPLTGQIANEINATEPTPEAVKVEPKEEIPAKSVETPKEEYSDLRDWAKKKGIDWTTDDSVLSALRKSDQQFHERRQKEKVTKSQPYAPPPPPQFEVVQPVYQPPVTSRAMLENIARQYNMPVEDAERLMAFNRDFYEAASRQDREKYNQQLGAIKLENEKNSVFRELSSDPVFKNPEVASEYYQVLEQMQNQDPESFEQDPRQYMRVYDRALQNIGRKKLMGQPLQEGVPPGARLPTTPPKQLGRGSGGGAYENEKGIDRATFDKMSSIEQRKILDSMGLIKSQ